MSFLRLNGWVVPVFDATPVRKHERSGRRGRSFRGQARDARRHVRRSWSCRACVLDHDDARSLEHLLAGEGHMVDLARGVEASTSLMPRPGYSSSLQFFPGSWGAYGRGLAAIPQAFSGVAAAWDAQLGDEWTVLIRRLVAGAFVGCAQRSDGTAYVGGVASSTFGLPASAGGAGLLFVVRDGVVELTKDQTATNEVVDDLVILPWRASDAMLEAFTDAIADVPKWGPMPVLRADGDMLGGTRLVMCSVTGAEYIQKPSHIEGIGWVTNAKVISFRVDEMDPLFVHEIEDQETTTPTPPGSPIAWFDAADVDGRRSTTIAQGASLATWVDRGSRASNATQGTAGLRPTFQRIASRRRLASSAAVRFDGADDYMATAAAAPNLSSPVTVAAVWRSTGVAGTAYVVDRALTAAFRARIFRAAAVHTIGSEATTATHATAVVADDWNASAAVLGAADSLQRLNGAEEQEAADLSDTTGTGGFTLGATDAGASPLGGDIAEVLVWSGAVDLAEVDAYLAARYEDFPG